MRRIRSLSVVGLLAALVLGPLAAAAPHAGATGGDSAGRAGALSPVRVTMKLGAMSAHGRVISRDTSCTNKVSVALFITDGVQVQNIGVFRTDRQGRWTTAGSMRGPALRGADPVKLFALVPGETGCRVAQSAAQLVPTTRAGRAARKVTIDFRQDGLEGRVTSPRASCENSANVAFFYRRTNRQRWRFGDTVQTNAHGRYRYEFLDEARTKAPVVAVVIGDGQCAVAQSAPTGLPAMT